MCEATFLCNRVGWPGGISPPGSLRSRRDDLPSPGSSHPSHKPVVAVPFPVGEQAGLSYEQPRPPCPEPSIGPQPAVLGPSPAPQVDIDTLEERGHLGPVEPAVVVHPPS